MFETLKNILVEELQLDPDEITPEAELANIDEAGFMQHGMNANNFTAGVVHYTGDVAAS